MLRFEWFRSAAVMLAGIEVKRVIRNSRLRTREKSRLMQQFYPLAAQTNFRRSVRTWTAGKFATETTDDFSRAKIR